MSSRDDVRKLRSLNRSEATVLYWKCHGKTYEQIGLDIDYSSDWVQLQMSNTYRKLGFNKDMHWRERTRLLEESYCKALRTMVRDDPKNLDQWPFAEEEPKHDPLMYPLVIYDEMQQRGLIPYDQGQTPPPPPEPQGRRIFRYALGLLALLAVGYAAYMIGTFREPETVTQLVTQAPVVETVIITSTPEPTILPTATEIVDLAATADAATALFIASLPTNTPDPTATPEPTKTPNPTPTPTPTPDPMNLTVGDTLKDDRVELTLKERAFNVNWLQGANWAIGYIFEFKNLSGETLILIIDGDDFRVVDNQGGEYQCSFPARPYDHSGFTVTMNHGDVYSRGVACGGRKIFGVDVTQVELFIDRWSSLPPSRWVVEVPH